MNIRYLVCMLAVLTPACSTMNDSLQLGASLGGAAGAAATFGGYSAGGKSPSFSTVAIGAGIGTAIGLLTSYLVHKQVAADRTACDSQQIEIRYGDLPPSPFIVPTKKGNR